MSGREDIARLINHPLRQWLLFHYAERVTSPSEVAAILGEPLARVSHHTRVLHRAGCLKLVRTEARRGATKHFYRTVASFEIEDADWMRLPGALRRSLARLVIDAGRDGALDALTAGGMDHAAAHLSRTPLDLDAQAVDDLAVLLRSVVDEAAGIQRQSRERGLGDSQSIELVVLSFKSAADS